MQLASLPVDILSLIVSACDHESKAQLRLVSTQMNSVATPQMRQLYAAAWVSEPDAADWPLLRRLTGLQTVYLDHDMGQEAADKFMYMIRERSGSSAEPLFSRHIRPLKSMEMARLGYTAARAGDTRLRWTGNVRGLDVTKPLVVISPGVPFRIGADSNFEPVLDNARVRELHVTGSPYKFSADMFLICMDQETGELYHMLDFPGHLILDRLHRLVLKHLCKASPDRRVKRGHVGARTVVGFEGRVPRWPHNLFKHSG